MGEMLLGSSKEPHKTMNDVASVESSGDVLPHSCS